MDYICIYKRLLQKIRAKPSCRKATINWTFYLGWHFLIYAATWPRKWFWNSLRSSIINISRAKPLYSKDPVIIVPTDALEPTSAGRPVDTILSFWNAVWLAKMHTEYLISNFVFSVVPDDVEGPLGDISRHLQSSSSLCIYSWPALEVLLWLSKW